MKKIETWGLEGSRPPFACRVFGHIWYNSVSKNSMIVCGEPCVRFECDNTRFNVPKDFDPGPIISILGVQND